MTSSATSRPASAGASAHGATGAPEHSAAGATRHSTTRTPATARRGPTFPRLVASEWVKLTSLRSTLWVTVVTVAVAFAVTYLAANASSGDPGFVPTRSLPDGVGLSQLGTLVLGVLAGTADFRTGAFRSTFTAAPRRVLVLGARTVATAGVAVVVAVLTLAATVLGVLPAAQSRDMSLDLTAGSTPQVLLGSGLLLVGMALLGLGLGSLLRRTVPAMVTALALVFVLPVGISLGGELSTSPTETTAEVEPGPTGLDPVSTVLAFLPGDAAFRMTTTSEDGGVDGAPNLGAWGGGLVFAGWILLPLAAAGVRLRTRDVT